MAETVYHVDLGNAVSRGHLAMADKQETINHPPHYGGDNPYEAIKVIEAWSLGFHLGNCLKYICRAKHKGTEIEDLKKARWYLDRYIQLLEKKGG